MTVQLSFVFSQARPKIKAVFFQSEVALETKPKKVLLCLRCDKTFAGVNKYRRICNECKTPKGKTRRQTWYFDCDLYSIALKARGGAW